MRIDVWGAEADALAALSRELPGVTFGHAADRDDALGGVAWDDDGFDFWAFDRRLDALAADDRALVVDAPLATVRAIATRAQRLAAWRNRHASGSWFGEVLAAHRDAHDLTKPLVRADLDHALDAWQWTVRRDRDATAEVQLAALLHDIERLIAEPDVRIEHHAPDYQAFKDAHARAGAALARDLLERASAPAAIVDATVALIAVHERAGDAPGLRAVNDADALSFFSLNAPGYLAYFGPEQTATKVAYTLGRMTPAARGELAGIRVPRVVRAAIDAHGGHRA